MLDPGAGAMHEEIANRYDKNWQFDFLFAFGILSWLIHAAVLILAAVVLQQAKVGAWVTPWIGTMLALSLLMALLAHAYRKRWLALPPSAYGWAHSVLTATAGLIWGTGALLCAHHANTQVLAFFTLVLGGTALGAVGSQHVLLRSCLLSLWTSIGLLTLAWLFVDIHTTTLAIAAMLLLFGLMLSMLAVRMQRALAHSMQLTKKLMTRNIALERTSARLAEAQDEKSRFLAQASHDLRQPIHAIGLLVESLKGLDGDDDTHEVLDSIDHSLESLGRLCRSLLDLAALDVGRVRPEIGPVPLNDVLGEVMRQTLASANDARVEIRWHPTRLWVQTDAALLHRMVQNLVCNAIKYAPGARLLVGVRRRAGRIAILVADRGPGILPTDRTRIFKEFVQIDTSDSGRMDGLGLGLSIVRRLADLLQLSIGLDSIPGKGSCFSINGLRPVAANPAPPRHIQPSHHVSRLRGLRVLVIDDDPIVLASTTQLLTRWGCNVQASGRFDLPVVPGSIDFILCDLELSGEASGLDLIRRLRHSSPGGAVLGAAIISGNCLDDLVEISKAEHIALLAKPVRPAQLRSALLAGLATQIKPSSEAMPAAAERV